MALARDGTQHGAKDEEQAWGGRTLQDQGAHAVFPARLGGCGERVDGRDARECEGATQGPPEDCEAPCGPIRRDRGQAVLLGEEVDEGCELDAARFEEVRLLVVGAGVQHADLVGGEGCRAGVVAPVDGDEPHTRLRRERDDPVPDCCARRRRLLGVDMRDGTGERLTACEYSPVDGEDGDIVGGAVGSTAINIRQLSAALVDDEGNHWRSGRVGLRVSSGPRRAGTIESTEEIGYVINGGRQEGADLRGCWFGHIPSVLF